MAEPGAISLFMIGLLYEWVGLTVPHQLQSELVYLCAGRVCAHVVLQVMFSLTCMGLRCSGDVTAAGMEQE